MKDLIEALQIIWKYLLNPNDYAPINCSHDMMCVCGVDVKNISYKDIVKLYKLGFIPGSDDNYDIITDILGEDFDWDELTKQNWEDIKNELDNTMFSFRFGSC